ncbi:MAG: TlpA family protein disulfide reductase [Deltaproteobacteria bacterium]|nr:TlpA family protein disulfide reductase [Deltaproteobacteria bacterium]
MKQICFPKITLMQVMLLILCVCIAFSAQAGKMIIEKGKKAPDFTLPDLKGEEYTLSRHSGEYKATLIIIWGVWCPYCRAIMVALKKDYSRLKAAGMEIVTISIRESPKKVALFINKLAPDFIVLTDEWGDLKDSYQIKDVPRIVILDRDQNVDAMAITTSAKMVETMIAKALKRQ